MKQNFLDRRKRNKQHDIIVLKINIVSKHDILLLREQCCCCFFFQITNNYFVIRCFFSFFFFFFFFLYIDSRFYKIEIKSCSRISEGKKKKKKKKKKEKR